jgi:hypothetical protein
MPAAAQLALGAAVAVAAYALAIGLAIAGVRLGRWAWLLVFAAIWVTCFVTLRKQMFAFLVGFVVSGGAIYMILSARGFRL